MKRHWLAAASALLIAAGAFALYAGSTLIVKPSEMKSGETKTITDDGRTITVTREGNTTHVKIDDAGRTDRLTITRDGDRLRISHLDSGGNRSLIVGPERRKIIIDGVPLDEFTNPGTLVPKHRSAQTWFVCPKDGTMMRVPEDKADQTFKCPVDGTTMQKKKGRGFTFFFDDNIFHSSEM
ncbi:MAG TPA: hypothetical protein VF980_09190 [Thermoanaerobaculia bacterium]